MQFFIKVLISITLIIFCTQIGRKFPSLSGLVATMPLTSLIVLLWLYTDNPGNYTLMTTFSKGALWGIIPSILFFISVYICFTKQLPLAIVLSASLGVWLVGASVHQWLLG